MAWMNLAQALAAGIDGSLARALRKAEYAAKERP
jgi:hypothetical protein